MQCLTHQTIPQLRHTNISRLHEIMQRIRFAYEHIPDFILAGVTSYNKGSLEFDNGPPLLHKQTQKIQDVVCPFHLYT